MFRTIQLELWYGFTVASENLSIDVCGNVQNDIVIILVSLMTMLFPIGRMGVNFDISYPKYSVHLDFGIEEVGACVVVGETWINDFQRLTFRRF